MTDLKVYTVQGDLHGETNDEEFPLMTLCDKCVKEYWIDSEQNLPPAPICEGCGCK